jgi:hypothetical protein
MTYLAPSAMTETTTFYGLPVYSGICPKAKLPFVPFVLRFKYS